jgi:hypothetical protein
METAWRLLAEGRVHARPSSEDEAKVALEWIAAREGKTLVQLVEELHAAASGNGQGSTSAADQHDNGRPA